PARDKREGGEAECGPAGLPADEDGEAGEDLEAQRGEDEPARQPAGGGIGHVAGDVAELGDAGGDEEGGDQDAAHEGRKRSETGHRNDPWSGGRDHSAPVPRIWTAVAL